MAYRETSVPVLLLVNAAEILSATFYSDGNATEPGTTTVGIVDETGAVILAAGTATTVGATGIRTRAITPTALGRWIVTWTTANLGTFTQNTEVVGAHLFTIAEAAAFDTMSAMTSASAAAIAEARYRILVDFEGITCAAFVPRWNRVTLGGSGNGRLFLPTLRPLSIVSIEERAYGGQVYTTFTADQLADTFISDIGSLDRESLGAFTSGSRNWRVTYTYGWAAPPADIRRAALMAAAYEMTQQTMNQRAISISTAAGTEQLYTPGISSRGSAMHPLPEVDRILRKYMECTPVVA